MLAERLRRSCAPAPSSLRPGAPASVPWAIDRVRRARGHTDVPGRADTRTCRGARTHGRAGARGHTDVPGRCGNPAITCITLRDRGRTFFERPRHSLPKTLLAARRREEHRGRRHDELGRDIPTPQTHGPRPRGRGHRGAVPALAASRRRGCARGVVAAPSAARRPPGAALRVLLGALRGHPAGRVARAAEGARPLRPLPGPSLPVLRDTHDPGRDTPLLPRRGLGDACAPRCAGAGPAGARRPGGVRQRARPRPHRQPARGVSGARCRGGDRRADRASGLQDAVAGCAPSRRGGRCGDELRGLHRDRRMCATSSSSWTPP